MKEKIMKIQNALKRKILILDGATGTELQKRGMPGGVCPEIWAVEHPEVITTIHSDYYRAGADIVYTCTFGANRIKLGEYNIQNVRQVNKKLALLARKAAPKQAFVAGDIGPTGRFVAPSGDLDFNEAVSLFKEQITGLLEGGVDLFVIETMMDIQEARAALIAVKEKTDLFTMVTMTYENDGRTLNGTDPVTALITLQSLGADAVGCNCSTGPEGMLNFIKSMKPFATVPLAAKPNAGLPRLENGKTIFDMDSRTFGSFARQFVSAGINIMGGCCGTTPDHIARLKKSIKNRKPKAPVRKTLSALSSAKGFVILGKDSPLQIVGERINPTGKKALQEELLNGKTSLVRALAKEQAGKGAAFLDVNVGVPNSDETKTLKQVISLLSTISELPLVIDTSCPEAMAMALRFYPGRALINSISGEKEKCKKLLPVAAQYGAMFILLPLTDTCLPETADKRIKIIRRIAEKAAKLGLSRDDLVIDCLVMTASSNPQSPAETLKTIRWCSDVFKARTIIGLSNVSFGMPQRKWINATFLAQALSQGLNMAIANPSSEVLMNIKRASDVLLGKDQDATQYIRHFSEESSPIVVEKIQAQTLEQKIFQAIIEGNRDDITDFIHEALLSGTPAEKLVNAFMIPAITKVGDLFDQKQYFLPQLIAGAETMKKGVGFLEPHLKKNKKQRQHTPTILLATVENDIHDIGKNIVSLMLKNHGFHVIDLGKDVSSQEIIKQISHHNPVIVGLSALMTTTMVNIKEVIDLAKEKGLKCKFMAGGAVVTSQYARSIGARYAKDGVEAVKVSKQLSE